MLNLSKNIIHQYKSSERKQLKKLKSKYGRKYQYTHGASKKRVWYDGELKTTGIKHNISKKLLLGSRLKCAYCGKRLIRCPKPIDHFIPNGKYPKYSFHPLNLLPSCTYCNSTIKGEYNPVVKWSHKYVNNIFFIVHPILHDVDHHIKYKNADKTLFDFDNCTIEGLNSIEFFKLHSEEMRIDRISQKLNEKHNPINNQQLKELVDACATYKL